MATHYTELMSGTEALVTTLGIFSANKGVIPAFTPLMPESVRELSAKVAAFVGSGISVQPLARV